MNRQDIVLRIAYWIQALGRALQRLGKRLEHRMAPYPKAVAVLASTWADNKRVRHVLPLDNAGGRALCGLSAGIHGWENLNHLNEGSWRPSNTCPTCLEGVDY